MTRRTTKTWVIALVAATLLLPAMGAVEAQGQSPQYHEKPTSYELSNGVVTVWFQGKKPLLRIASVQDANRSYQLRLSKVVEFQDVNGDHAYNASEQVAFLNLDQAKGWNVSAAQANGSLTLTLRLHGVVHTSGPLGNVTPPVGLPVPGANRTANVTLVFHIASHPEALVTGANATTNLSTSEVKFDLLVDHWSWVHPQADQLALVGAMPTAGNASLNATASRVDVTRNGSLAGAVSWASTAQVTTGNNTTTAAVVPSYVGSVNATNGSAMVAWAVNASGYDHLAYDPTMSVQSASSNGTMSGNGTGSSFGSLLKNVPGPGLALVVGAGVLAAAAYTERRRR